MSKIYKFAIVALLLLTTTAFAQRYTISGVVTNTSNGEKLIGANVYIKALNIGGVTNGDGVYEITMVPRGTYEMTVSYIGFVTKKENIYVNNNVSMNVSLNESSVLLGETVVKGTRAKYRETPVAFSEIKGSEIEFKLASRDVPAALEQVPGVYASQQGGGYGDARLMIRGFDQRNIAVMINGVPVNDMENGWVYWSNWAGLGDVTSSIQVQRGLGASPYSVSAIGGIVNIITNGVGGRQEFAKLRYATGSDGLTKTTASFASNITKKIGITALVSRKRGNGYADQTWINEFTYFFSVGGVFGNHSLEFTGVGSPQTHGQRLYESSINTYYTRGFNYNPNWGYLNGKPLLERENFYHKPQFNLNWNWQLNDKSVLATVAYFSFGTGGGTGAYGNYWSYARTNEGLRNWDAMYASNSTNIDSTYSTRQKRSLSAIRASRNNHNWYGLLSTYKTNLTDDLILNVGIDTRYYRGEHYRTLENLLGGDYFVDVSRGHQRNVNDAANAVKYVGNKVNYYNDGVVVQYGGFTQLEYSTPALSAFVNISSSNTGYQRVDYFNFLDSDPAQTTDWQNFLGYTAKAGINFNLDEVNNIFVNAGYFSKAPLFRNVFDYNNNVYKGTKNEKIMSFEVGYGISTSKLALKFNGYYTRWEDRALNTSVTNPATGTNTIFNIFGATENHYGGEFEGRWMPNRNVELNGSLSISSDKFGSDLTAVVRPEDDPTIEKNINSYVNGLYIGDFPMTTASVGFIYRLTLNNGASMYFNPVYKFRGRQYAQFNPDRRSNPNDKENSWRMPDYYLFDIHVGYDVLFTDFFFKKLSVGLHLFNALNTDNYITDAQDGGAHDAQSALVFYGRDRNYNVSFTFEF